MLVAFFFSNGQRQRQDMETPGVTSDGVDRKQSVQLTVGQQVAVLNALDAGIARVELMTRYTISSRTIERILSRRLALRALPRYAWPCKTVKGAQNMVLERRVIANVDPTTQPAAVVVETATQVAKRGGLKPPLFSKYWLRVRYGKAPQSHCRRAPVNVGSPSRKNS